MMASITSGTILISICLLLALGPPQCWAYRTDCQFHPYQGPPGQVILKFTPTLPAKLSLHFSTNLLSIFTDIVGVVPVAGSVLGSFYGTLADLTDPTAGDLNKLVAGVNKLIDGVRTSINDLKNYMDAKINQHDLDLKIQTLKGHLTAGTHLFLYHDAAEKKRSLTSLNVDLLSSQPTFLTKDPRYETFEQLLPLTRTFVDFHLAVLTELFNMTKSGDYKNEIKSLSVTAYNWYKLAVSQVIKQHTSFPEPECASDNVKQVCIHMMTTTCVSCTMTGVTCRQDWKDGDGCDHDVSHDPESCLLNARDTPLAKKGLQLARESYFQKKSTSIKTYWRVEMGDDMEKLKQIGIKAGATESQYTTHIAVTHATGKTSFWSSLWQGAKAVVSGLFHAWVKN